MLFVILGYDGPEGPARRPQHRPEHLARLQALAAQGRLVLAGPFASSDVEPLRGGSPAPRPGGSLIILQADSLEAARAFADADPYARHGVFTRVEVRPFTQVFPLPS
jgi:uncharacterized protein YciI